MRNTDQENKIPCLVDYGIIYSKRDMIRILRDLDKVEYVDMIDNLTVAQGQGYVIEVFANAYDSTLVFNNRLHINVNGFEILKMKTDPEKIVELVSGHRTIKLKPLPSTSTTTHSHIEEDIDEQRIALAAQMACDNEVDIDYE